MLLSHKKNDVMPFAETKIDMGIYMLSEKRWRKANIMWYHLHVESKKWYKWNYLQNGNRLTDIEKENLWFPERMMEGEIN